MARPDPLPIDAVLDDLRAALAGGGMAVLVAPPGAGKTTRVPLALLDEPWLGGRRIVLLEPRRLAARAAAERMAGQRDENVGETIGIRARLDTRVGPATRIEVVTEGVFTRMLIDDPMLAGVGVVIFDEYHERSLDADLGLALVRDARLGLREDLRLLVMSATLDGARVAQLIDDAPVITCEGRAYPVETRYLGRPEPRRLEEAMAAAIERALAQEPGSLLAFLPGQAEIRRTWERLAERIGGGDIDIVALHGGLEARAQRAAIAPAPAGRRKVVLATAIAQTSLTIEGVRLVVDCGLERVPRYEPDVGVTRLETVRVSRATADQRRGRAGRTESGLCYRLWAEAETTGLPAFTDPEIRAADLTGLILDCAAWGVTDPSTLAWLDPPPKGALAAARAELQGLGAIDARGALTRDGDALRSLPLPARVARMVLEGARRGAGPAAAAIAAVLVERSLGGPSLDIDERLRRFATDRSPRAQGMAQLARGWARQAAGAGQAEADDATLSTAALLALAFPDRIAKARGGGQFLLANGRGVVADPASPLARAGWLVVAEMSGVAAAARILLAAELAEADVAVVAGERIADSDEVTFERSAAALRARRVTRLGAIVMASEPRPVPAGPGTAAVLARGLAGLGIERLPWSRGQKQLRDRVGFLRRLDAKGAQDWPDLSDAHLAATAEDWLAPFLGGATKAADIGPEPLGQALDALLPWPLKSRLEADAPTHYEAPTGNRHAIDYESDGAPVLAIRVQELFGLTRHPALADGRLPLTLHLLSPAHRPIQITADLPGFWSGSWRDVKAQMKGRYPKHPWPDDPAAAQPTARAKPRGT